MGAFLFLQVCVLRGEKNHVNTQAQPEKQLRLRKQNIPVVLAAS
jgi:hypothetical protein